MVEKKPLRWTYPINYLDNVVSAHLFTDSYSYRKFEDVQQQFILIIEVKDGRQFKIISLRKPKKTTNPDIKDAKATKVVEKIKKFSFNIKKLKKALTS